MCSIDQAVRSIQLVDGQSMRADASRLQRSMLNCDAIASRESSESFLKLNQRNGIPIARIIHRIARPMTHGLKGIAERYGRVSQTGRLSALWLQL